VSLPKSSEMRDTSSPRSFSLYFCRALVALLHLGGTTKRGSVSRRTLIGFGALLALGVVLVIGILIGVVIGRAGSVKTPVGEATIEQSSPTTVTVRVSGTKGLGYTGTIGTSETGQKSIDGTLDTIPEDYELPLNTSSGSTDGVTAEVGKNPLDVRSSGTLRLQLLVDGQVVRDQESSSDTGVVSFTYNAMEAREGQ
jgi:hypothetical protein